MIKVILKKGFNLFFVILWIFLTACQSDKTWSRNRRGEISNNNNNNNNNEEKEKEPVSGEKALTYRPLLFSWDEDENIYKIFSQLDPLDCDNCPDSFGNMVRKSFLTIEEKHLVETGHCQGSLIDEDLFLTARHCLPEEVKNPGDSCRDKIKIILPKVDGKPVEILGCERLVSLSEDFDSESSKRNENPYPDWAVLKLQQTSSRFVRVSVKNEDKQGISDDERLFGFIPLENTETGETILTQFQCRAVQNSIYFPEYNEDQTTMVFLKCDRQLTKGFSGTTLFRKNKTSGYVPVAVLSHLIETDNQKPLSFSNKAIGSQISCIDNESESCQFHPEKRKEALNQLMLKILSQSKSKIDREVESWVKDQNHPVRWKIVNLENWSQLPGPYLRFFKANMEKDTVMGSRGYYLHYLQNLIPIYPECVRPKFIEEQQGLKNLKIPIEVPMVSFSVNREGEFKKITTHHEISRLSAYLTLSQNAQEEMSQSVGETFVIRFSSPIPHFNPSGESIISSRFKHSFAVIPICSEGT